MCLCACSVNQHAVVTLTSRPCVPASDQVFFDSWRCLPLTPSTTPPPPPFPSSSRGWGALGYPPPPPPSDLRIVCVGGCAEINNLFFCSFPCGRAYVCTRVRLYVCFLAHVLAQVSGCVLGYGCGCVLSATFALTRGGALKGATGVTGAVAFVVHAACIHGARLARKGEKADCQTPQHTRVRQINNIYTPSPTRHQAPLLVLPRKHTGTHNSGRRKTKRTHTHTRTQSCNKRKRRENR